VEKVTGLPLSGLVEKGATVVYQATVAGRRLHDRVDLCAQHVDCWLAQNNSEAYSACRLLNLSYTGMCLLAEDWFETGRCYRFTLDLSRVLGSEVKVAARVIWKEDLDAGICYVGAVFTSSSSPWLGPDEDENP